MTPLLYSIGQFCARRRLLVLGVWLLVASGSAPGRTIARRHAIDDNVTLPGTESQRAANILQSGFGSAGTNGSNPIVLRAAAGTTLTGAAQRDAVQRTVAAYAHDPGVLSAISPLGPAGAAQLSRDDRIGYISVTLRAGPAALTIDQARHFSRSPGPRARRASPSRPAATSAARSPSPRPRTRRRSACSRRSSCSC